MNNRRRNTVRIDYDRLAEAIVKSQHNINKDDIKTAIIEANEELEADKNKHTYSGEVLGFLTSPILAVFSALGLGFSAFIIYAVITYRSILVINFASGFVVILLSIFFIIAGITFSYISWQASRELRKTNDIKLISTMLTNLSTFVAMIIAIIALIISINE